MVQLFSLGDLGGINADLFLAFAVPLKPDDAVDLREDRIVGSLADIVSWEELGPALANDNGSRVDRLPAIGFDAQALAAAVPPVLRGALRFCVRHFKLHP